MPQSATPPSSSCRASSRRGGRNSAPSAIGVTTSATLWISGLWNSEGGLSGCCFVGAVAVAVAVAVAGGAGTALLGGSGLAISAAIVGNGHN